MNNSQLKKATGMTGAAKKSREEVAADGGWAVVSEEGGKQVVVHCPVCVKIRDLPERYAKLGMETVYCLKHIGELKRGRR